MIHLAFFGSFLLAFLLAAPVDQLVGRIITLQSEYRVVEQLSKFYGLVTIVVSVLAYGLARDLKTVRLSISFILLSLVLYLAESDMIQDEVQPLFGFIFSVCVVVLLFSQRQWAALPVFALALADLAVGGTADTFHEHAGLASRLPGSVTAVLSNVREDHWEALGLGLVCLAAIVCFRGEVLDVARHARRWLLSLLAICGTIAVGNGFSAFVYRPRVIREVALVLNFIGFLALVYVNKRHLRGRARLTLINNEDYWYLFMFSLFVVLPSTYGRIGNVLSLLLWLPAAVLLGITLYRRHPLRGLEATPTP